ncbi:MAG: hypothetical protein MUE42_14290, partial [Opitutaceae bacterium]|nr:hypothetical protein [Opitutaceae bacterium]
AWPSGSFAGLRARGGFEVDLEWNNSALTRVRVRSLSGLPCRIHYDGHTRDFTTAVGQVIELNGALKNL